MRTRSAETGSGVDWYERTERQVGATGISDVRRLLVESGAAAVSQRRQRTAAALLVAGAVAISGLFVVLDAARPQPLPPGIYNAAFEEGDVAVVVDADGSVALDAPAEVDVDLEFNEDGQVLDSFTVATDLGAWDLRVEVTRDGEYSITRTPVATSDEQRDGGARTPPPSPSPARDRDTPARTTPRRGGTDAPVGGDPAAPVVPADPGVGDDPPRVGTEQNPGRGHGPADNPGRGDGRDGTTPRDDAAEGRPSRAPSDEG